MPSMTVTPVMCNAMRDVLARTDLIQMDRDLLERYGPQAKAYPMDVVELLRHKLHPKPYLHDFLQGSSVAPPEPLPKKKRNPELEERLGKIKAELEEKEYEEMTRDVRKSEFSLMDQGEIKSASSAIGEGVSILVTKGTFFALGYFASVSAWGFDATWNMIAGLVGLIFGFAVETTLFILRQSRIIGENERSKKRKDKERSRRKEMTQLASQGISVEGLESGPTEGSPATESEAQGLLKPTSP